MLGSFDNIHPGLSQEYAIQILSREPDELECKSDYYMAASHLVNFPGVKTEFALFKFLNRSSSDTSIRLAQRKAVEILGRLGVKNAINHIIRFLDSNDIYMIENVVWALGELCCKDKKVHRRLIELLVDSAQNQRVILQSLSKLNVTESLPLIIPLQQSKIPSVRGAAIAASFQLSGEKSRIGDLAEHLYLPNQMDRQSAIQDVIDSRANTLLFDVISAPISPVFRMRAVKSLVKIPDKNIAESEALTAVDKILRDDPRDIIVLHHYGESLSDKLLLEGLFHPDFSRCYLAMQTLLNRDPDDLWKHVQEIWRNKASNDYGAHYFFMHLFGLISGWSVSALDYIKEILVQSINDKRPQFLKSGPAALLSLGELFPEVIEEYFDHFLMVDRNIYWQSRYALLMIIESNLAKGITFKHRNKLNDVSSLDPEPLIRLKANLILSKTISRKSVKVQ